jgi:(p)ppGpp synthase/HD superfamily hydrolase
MASLIFDAIEFAAAAHAGQYRKGSPVPYIVHPINVARTVLNLGCPEHVGIAAVLHDTVEDTGTALATIRDRFGARVAELVHLMSEPDKVCPWEARKQHTLEALKTSDEEFLLLALADKLDNVRSIREDLARRGESLWSVFKRPREAQRWYYESLADVFRPRVGGTVAVTLFHEFEREVRTVFGPL